MTNNRDKNKQNGSGNRRQGVLGLMAGGKRPWVILIFAATVVILWVLLSSMRSAGMADAAKRLGTFTVRRDNLTITVTESGSIKARNETEIKSGVEGRATIIAIVPEGSYVTQEDVDNGKVLVELDSSELVERVASYEIEFANAEAAYLAAKEEYDIQVKQNESDVTAAELMVKFALMDFQKYLGEVAAEELIADMNQASEPHFAADVQGASLSSPTIDISSHISSLLNDPNEMGLCMASQTLMEYENNILLAEGTLTRAEYKLDGTQQLYDANYAAAIELMADELDKKRSEVQTKEAGIALDLFKRYEFPKEAEKLLSDYYEAGRELDRTRARARAKLAQAQAQVKSTEANYKLRDDRLSRMKDQIVACVIRAPAPGLVVYSSSQDFYSGRGRGGMGGGGSSRNIDEGETVYERQKIISLPDTSEMMAEIAVHESSVDMVRPGLRADIVIDAFPDKRFEGEVIKVALLPDPQRGFMNPDLKVYSTEVSIEGQHEFLKPGMSAKVEILVEQLDDVLIVPIQVVANREGKKVCYVLSPKGPEEREVQTGAFNDTFVEIKEGVEAGEEVLLNPPRATEQSVKDRLNQREEPREDSESSRDGEPPAGRRPPQDLEIPGGGKRQPGGQGPGGARRQPGAQGPGGKKGQGPFGGQFELTDEIIGRILDRMAENNPERANELEQLRQSDPEKFKAELMRGMRERMGQGRNREGQAGNARGGQNR